MIRFENVVGDDNIEGPFTSLTYYFGHSMLVFNQGLVGEIQRYLGGGYMLNTAVGSVDALTGAQTRTGFYTYIGSLYIDYGPIGTICLVLICSTFLYHLVRKQKFDMADLMVYVYFLNFIAGGFTVVGRGYYLGFLMVFFLSVLLKIIIKRKEKSVINVEL